MVSTSMAAMGFGTGSNSAKRKAGWADRAGGKGNENSDDSEDDEQVLRDMLGKQNLKEGAKVASDTSKKMHKKDKDKVTGGGSFQSLGLPPTLLKALLQRGFTTPTPIQRAALPAALATPPRDIVGMARTGSGKTLAYMIPLIARLGGLHSPKFGARALVLVPTRELALQVLKVGKDLARGYTSKKGGDEAPTAANSESLRWGLVVGGDSLEEQYAMMASNPDVIIATPGRLLHLLVEMSADLRAVQYVVFDEADRLFELGFSTSLNEILSKLSPNRQTLLFSATLPKSLVEFAKAGLQSPKLVRLDAESKISNDLQMAFVSVKPKEKEAALLVLLRDVIRVPEQTAEEKSEADWLDAQESGDIERHFDKKRKLAARDKKGKGKKVEAKRDLAQHQTIVFAATKHHVEYLSLLLAEAGYAVSAIYGSLDQAARRNQLNNFRAGRTTIMVVTDLAARGIDIPILSNVVNYDFPVGSRTFVHRVGRTARAGRKGWAYSFVTNSELAHLYDLQLFLGRPLLVAPLAPGSVTDAHYSTNLILGSLPRDRVDLESDHFRNNLLEPNSTLVALLGVAEKGQKMYERSQGKASQESYRRAKELTQSAKGLAGSEREEEGVHPIFAEVLGPLTTRPTFSARAPAASTSSGSAEGTSAKALPSRTDLLAQVNAFRPNETIFELGKKGAKTPESQVMLKRRVSLGKAKARAIAAQPAEADKEDVESIPAVAEADDDRAEVSMMDMPGGDDQADEGDLEAVFGRPKAKRAKGDYKDPSVYMDYRQQGMDSERGYSLNEGSNNFASQAASATYDLTATDEDAARTATQKASMLRWDRKHKKFVQGDGTGADNKKMIRTESGAKLPASFKSGSFDDWKKKQKLYLPKVGEAELKDRRMPTAGHGAGAGNKRYRHQQVSAGRDVNAKPKRDGRGGVEKDFGAGGRGKAKGKGKKGEDGADGKTRSSGTKGLMGGKRAGAQLKSVDQIRKERAAKEKRVKRSTMPGKKGGGGKGRK